MRNNCQHSLVTTIIVFILVLQLVIQPINALSGVPASEEKPINTMQDHQDQPPEIQPSLDAEPDMVISGPGVYDIGYVGSSKLVKFEPDGNVYNFYIRDKNRDPIYISCDFGYSIEHMDSFLTYGTLDSGVTNTRKDLPFYIKLFTSSALLELVVQNLPVLSVGVTNISKPAKEQYYLLPLAASAYMIEPTYYFSSQIQYIPPPFFIYEVRHANVTQTRWWTSDSNDRMQGHYRVFGSDSHVIVAVRTENEVSKIEINVTRVNFFEVSGIRLLNSRFTDTDVFRGKVKKSITFLSLDFLKLQRYYFTCPSEGLYYIKYTDTESRQMKYEECTEDFLYIEQYVYNPVYIMVIHLYDTSSFSPPPLPSVFGYDAIKEPRLIGSAGFGSKVLNHTHYLKVIKSTTSMFTDGEVLELQYNGSSATVSSLQELQTPYRMIGYPSKNPDSGRELDMQYYFPFLLPISVNSSQQQLVGLEAAYVLLDHIMPFGILEATPKGTYLDYGIIQALFDARTGYLVSLTSKTLNLSYYPEFADIFKAGNSVILPTVVSGVLLGLVVIVTYYIQKWVKKIKRVL